MTAETTERAGNDSPQSTAALSASVVPYVASLDNRRTVQRHQLLIATGEHNYLYFSPERETLFRFSSEISKLFRGTQPETNTRIFREQTSS